MGEKRCWGLGRQLWRTCQRAKDLEGKSIFSCLLSFCSHLSTEKGEKGHTWKSMTSTSVPKSGHRERKRERERQRQRQRERDRDRERGEEETAGKKKTTKQNRKIGMEWQTVLKETTLHVSKQSWSTCEGHVL